MDKTRDCWAQARNLVEQIIEIINEFTVLYSIQANDNAIFSRGDEDIKYECSSNQLSKLQSVLSELKILLTDTSQFQPNNSSKNYVKEEIISSTDTQDLFRSTILNGKLKVLLFENYSNCYCKF